MVDRNPLTLLRRAITLDNLRRAWNDVAENRGISGVDDVSIPVWRRNWEERLVELQQTVLANRYKPARLRIRRIPKKKAGEFRTLRIPTVTDRVLQRAILIVMHEFLDPLFLPCSFGYRPGLGVKDAVKKIHDHRKRGRTHVLDADIDDFFNQVDHERLMYFLRIDLPDNSLLPLIRQWLDSGRPNPDSARGIPMGSPLSPLLANIYLHRLDVAAQRKKLALVRYADDFIVLTRSPARLQAAYKQIESFLAALKLRFELEKTQLATFEEGFDFLGVHFEDSWHWYVWRDKRIQVPEDEPDWFFDRYGPDY